jgi:hypothetical protein
MSCCVGCARWRHINYDPALARRLPCDNPLTEYRGTAFDPEFRRASVFAGRMEPRVEARGEIGQAYCCHLMPSTQDRLGETLEHHANQRKPCSLCRLIRDWGVHLRFKRALLIGLLSWKRQSLSIGPLWSKASQRVLLLLGVPQGLLTRPMSSVV